MEYLNSFFFFHSIFLQFEIYLMIISFKIAMTKKKKKKTKKNNNNY